jgi:hypothetical protein
MLILYTNPAQIENYKTLHLKIYTYTEVNLYY